MATAVKRSVQTMHPALIQAALKMNGATQADVAAQCGRISTTAVYQVIHGRSRSRRIEARIASITGLLVSDLWPQWYGPEAQRRRARNRPSPTQVAEALRAFVG